MCISLDFLKKNFNIFHKISSVQKEETHYYFFNVNNLFNLVLTPFDVI